MRRKAVGRVIIESVFLYKRVGHSHACEDGQTSYKMKRLRYLSKTDRIWMKETSNHVRVHEPGMDVTSVGEAILLII